MKRSSSWFSGSLIPLGRRPSSVIEMDTRPDWVQANPRLIERASQRAQSRSGGGWVVLDASRRIGAPRPFVVDGREWVAWRAEGVLRVAPDVCPHMGARLSEGRVLEGALACPWHGLKLSGRHGCWSEVPAYDDGVLAWARVLASESPTDAPVIPARPEVILDGVVRMEAACDPEDVVANRLDPWHGAHYHPHSFARLRVLEADADGSSVRVAFRIAGPWVVEVDCTFHAPTRRSIVMTITDGEGARSVVETHASPIGPARCAVVEATLATSTRSSVRHLGAVANLMRPFVERRAARLWVEDVAYAERRYALRSNRRGASRGERKLLLVDP